MRTPLIVAAISVLGISPLFLRQGAPPSKPLGQFVDVPILQSTSGPAADVIEWTVWVDATTESVQAVLRSSATTFVPYFTDVRLTAMSGGAEIDCGPFPRPIMTDNGVSRMWIYTSTRPKLGACSSSSPEGIGATGVRDGVTTKATRRR